MHAIESQTIRFNDTHSVDVFLTEEKTLADDYLTLSLLIFLSIHFSWK